MIFFTSAPLRSTARGSLRRSPGFALRSLPIAAAVVFGVAPLRAQVGYQPDKSPYEDLKTSQLLTFSFGRLGPGLDPAGVGPKASSLFSLQYDLPVGGPASTFVRYGFAPSTRTVFDPAKPAATRVVGTPNVTTHMIDLGLDVSLTGQKTWHRLLPSVTGGVGIVSDFANADTGAYKFGTKFSFNYGGVMRYVMRNGWVVRADLTNRVWQYQYPDKYFVKASDTTSVLTDTKLRSAWRSNWSTTIGVSMPIFR